MAEPLAQQAQKFARQFSEVSVWLAGSASVGFETSIIGGVENPQAFQATVEPVDSQNIPLFGRGREILQLYAEWDFCTSSDSRWLKARSSKFHIFPAEDPTKPIVRYEFDSRLGKNLPAAHFHLHTENQHLQFLHNQEFEDSLGLAGTGSQRAKKRAKNPSKNKLHTLHFPLGGTRFRPSLEEVLLMLIEEFGIEPAGQISNSELKQNLKQRVKEWRLMQTRSAVRDAPAEAAQQLRELGYEVQAPGDGDIPMRDDNLTSL